MGRHPGLVKPGARSYISASYTRQDEADMAQSSRILDDIGRLMNDAAGVADGFRREIETAVKAQAERFVMDMDLVKRDDYDALRELVQAQGEELKALRAELAEVKGKPSKRA
jgi:BMFP domain-containing protein YqiC